MVDRKRAAAILKSQASLRFLAILMTDAFSFAASQLTVMQAELSAGFIGFASFVVSKSTKIKVVKGLSLVGFDVVSHSLFEQFMFWGWISKNHLKSHCWLP